jgi:hypothetical protein
MIRFSAQVYLAWPAKGQVENFFAESAEEAREYCKKYHKKHGKVFQVIARLIYFWPELSSEVEQIVLYQILTPDRHSKIWKWSPAAGWRRGVGPHYLSLSEAPDEVPSEVLAKKGLA